MKKLSKKILLLSASWSLVGATGALAQTANEPTPPDQRAEDTAIVDDIVVTATRREETLQKTPISIIAFDRRAIERQGMNTLTDIENATPGISFASKGGGNSSGFVTVRGLFDLSRNVGFEQRLGVYVDGVYLGRTYNLNQSVLGLQRIEVLRGPQGTLFGKATPAGAISLTTRLPGDTLVFETNAEVGNYDYRLLNAYVSGPISDRLSGSIGFEIADREGYTRELAFPDETFNQISRYTARGALRYAASDDLDVILRFDGQKASTPLATLEDNTLSDPRPYVDSADFFQTDRNSSFGSSLEVAYNAPGGGSLVSLSAYREGSFKIRNDTDRSPNAFLIDQLDERLRQFSQEVRYISPKTESFDYVAGLFFMHQNLSADRLIETGSDFGAIIPGVGAGLTDRGPSRLNSTTIAAFGNANWRPSDLIELTAGIRVTNDRKRLRYSLIEDIGIFINIPDYRGRRNDIEITPRAGVNLHIADDVMLYASYARGYTGGGWNADWVADPKLDFGTEHVNNYELGLRSVFAQGKVLFNVTGFYGDISSLQVPQFINTPNGLTAVNITNAASGLSAGIEVESVLKPFRGLTLSASATYNDAHYRAFPGCGFVEGAIVACGGHRLIFAPEWKAFVSAEYRTTVGGIPGHISVYGDYAYTGSVYADSLNSASNFAPGFDELSFRVSWEPTERFTFTAWVRNAENDANVRFQQVGLLGTPFVQYNPPRMYGLKVGYKY